MAAAAASATAAPTRGLHFEDFAVGMELTTPARTVTAADIANACALTGNFNAMHADAEAAREMPCGGIVAPAALVYGMAEGLQHASGINEGTLLALLQIDRWRLLAPVRAGDTVHMAQTVIATHAASRGGRGVVTFARQVRNQRGETVMEMEAALLYRRRVG